MALTPAKDPVSQTSDLFSSSVPVAGANQLLSGPSPGLDGRVLPQLGPQTAGLSSVPNAPFSPVANPLNDFFQVAYHFKLSTDGGSEIIIAESGVTGFNIQDIELQSVVAPSSTLRSTTATEINFTISEPNGTSFLDALRSAAIQSAGSQGNYAKLPYILTLWFTGYSESGEPIPNVLSNFDGSFGGIWMWRITIRNIQTKFDQSGTRYQISAILSDDIAISSDGLGAGAGRTPTVIAPKGKTFGEWLDTTTSSLNKAYADMYQGAQPPYNFVGFKIAETQGVVTEAELRAMEVSELNPDENTVHLYDENGLPRAQITDHTPIPDIVLTLFAATPKARELGIGARAGGVTKYLPFVQPRVERGDYIPALGQYQQNITYYIWLYASQKPIIQEDEVLNPSSTDAQKVQQLIARGALKKQYDFYYTGTNTEVLNLDVNFNMAFEAIITSLAARTDDSTAFHAKANENNASPNYIAESLKGLFSGGGGPLGSALGAAGVAGAAVGFAGSALGKLGSVLSGTMPTANTATGSGETLVSASRRTALLPTQISSVLSGFDGLSTATSSLTSLLPSGFEQTGVVSSGTQAGQLARELDPSAGSRVFAEDLALSSEYPVPLSIRKSREEPKQALGFGTQNSSTDFNKSLFGAVVDQMHAPMTSDLMSIEMEIRGDPYWLGVTNTEDPAAYSGSGRPVFFSGDQVVLIRFRFPYTTDDDTYQPMLRNQDVFNGFYFIKRITHRFNEGEFRQVLQCARIATLPSDVPDIGSSAVSGLVAPGTAVDPPASSAPTSPVTNISPTAANAYVSSYADAIGTDETSAIRTAANGSDVSPGFLYAVAAKESGFDPAARASTSSAQGLFQFTEDTWLRTFAANGTKYGYGPQASAIQFSASGKPFVSDPALRQQILDLRTSPAMSSKLAVDLTQANKAALTSGLGRAPNNSELYTAHFLGSSGAVKFLTALRLNPTQPAASVVPTAASANKSIFYTSSNQPKSIQEVFQGLAGNIDEYAAAFQSRYN